MCQLIKKGATWLASGVVWISCTEFHGGTGISCSSRSRWVDTSFNPIVETPLVRNPFGQNVARRLRRHHAEGQRILHVPVGAAGGRPRALLADGRDAHEQIQSARRLSPQVRLSPFFAVAIVGAVVQCSLCERRWVRTVAGRDQEGAGSGRRLLAGQRADEEDAGEEEGAFSKARRSVSACLCGCLLDAVIHCEAEIGLDKNPHAADQEHQEHERSEALERRAAAVAAAASLEIQDEEATLKDPELDGIRDTDADDEGDGSPKPGRGTITDQPLLDPDWNWVLVTSRHQLSTLIHNYSTSEHVYS